MTSASARRPSAIHPNPGPRAPVTVVARWAAIHAAVLLLAAAATAIAIAWWPEAMLAGYARRATLMQAAGARTSDELGSAVATFRHVLVMNATTLAVFSLVAYVGQALLALPFAGAFYAMVAQLAPRAIGRSLAPQDWLLVGLEAAMLVAATALTAAIGGHRFGFGPGIGGLLRFWHHAWRRWWPAPVASWRDVRAAWGGLVPRFGAALACAWLAAAALEAFGG